METEQRSNEKRAIKGTVLDESGIPIIGANVMQGKGTGVITDINGNFTIVADPNQPLTVSYIGFDSQQVKAGNKNNLKIYLKESSIALNEIVVVGYGSQSEN